MVRPESQADRQAILEVHRRAFGGEAEVGIVEGLWASDAFIPELSLVAVDGGKLVGHVILSRARLDDRAALALGPIGVLPEHQRRGIGALLMRAAHDAARARGEDVVVLLGHPEYYPRFGYVPAATLGITGGFDGPPFMAYELRAGGAAGGGRFEYPPAFGV